MAMDCERPCAVFVRACDAQELTSLHSQCYDHGPYKKKKGTYAPSGSKVLVVKVHLHRPLCI